MRKNKLLLLLVLLMTAATGAVAQEPELLVTIESNGNGTSSKTFDGKAILTFGGGRVSNDNDDWGWFNYSTGEEISLTVTGADGYTVTSCTFYTKSSSKTVEGEHPTVYVTGSPSHTYTATGKGGNDLGEYGVTKIEVYGYAPAPTYAITLAEGTEDADKWSISPNPAEEGATVTATYSGDKKVKSVKAVKKGGATVKSAKDATAEDLGKVIGIDGKIYNNVDAAQAAGTTGVAMIVYVGSATGETSYNHGLALALKDANNGSNRKWKTSNTDAGHNKQTDSNFTTESGLQYNDDTHNSDTYPAFKAAMDNNGTASPTGCSAWFLPTGYQWNQMINACKNVLGTNNNRKDLSGGFSGVGGTNLKNNRYWSSTENDADKAWRYDFGSGNWGVGNKNLGYYVRSAIAF